VVLVTLDTLRYDSLAGSGESPSLMPLTLARTRAGRTFERAFAASTCTQPTHATLFTGLHPWAHGVTANGRVLEERHVTIAEILAQAGFDTAAVVASVPVQARFGFAQGFRRFREPFTEGFGPDTWEGTKVEGGRFYALGGTVTDEALRLLDGFTAPRQFLWVHYFDPHAPYGDGAPGADALTPAEVVRRIQAGGAGAAGIAEQARGLYGADVRALDGHLERLLARLELDAAGIETHLVVTSDHGESLGEGGVIGHGDHLTPEQVRVPLFVLSPRVAPGRDPRTTGSIDLAPTLLSLSGVRAALPGGCDLAAPQGRPCLTVGMRRTYQQPHETLRTDGSRETLSGLLFYLADEQGRLHVGDGSSVREPGAGEAWTRGLTRLFRSFEANLGGRPGAQAMDPETEKALRALGYVP
jgi:arylsulfatase A-like enzyme